MTRTNLHWFGFLAVFTVMLATEARGDEHSDVELQSWSESCDSCSDTACDVSCSQPCCKRPCLQVPNMIGDEGLGVPRVFGTAASVIHFPDHFSKVSRNNSPIPRTRAYFDYAHLHSMQATSFPAGNGDRTYDANAFRFGVEWACIDDLISIEAIVPFYDSIGSEVDDTNFNGIGDTEFGNVALGLKGLLWSNDDAALSAGLRLELPTREDQEGITSGAVIERDTLFFQPYVAGLATRDDWFAQGFIGARLRDSDDDATTGGVPITNLTFITRNLFFADIGVGKHICKSDCGNVRAITPMLELHYQQSIESGDPLLLTEALYGSNVNNLNLTAGVTTTFATQSTLSIAAVVPLRKNSIVSGGLTPNLAIDTDRLVPFQLAVQFNHYFGR